MPAALLLLGLLLFAQISSGRDLTPPADPTASIWDSGARKLEVVEAIKEFRRNPRSTPDRLLQVVRNRRFPAWHRRLCLFEYFSSRGHDIKLSALLRDVLPLNVLREESVFAWTSVTALPEPFALSRRWDCEYYALEPRLPRGDRSAIVLEVQGRWEPRRPISSREFLLPQSPFLMSMRGSLSGRQLMVLRVGIFDDDGLFPSR